MSRFLKNPALFMALASQAAHVRLDVDESLKLNQNSMRIAANMNKTDLLSKREGYRGTDSMLAFWLINDSEMFSTLLDARDRKKLNELIQSAKAQLNALIIHNTTKAKLIKRVLEAQIPEVDDNRDEDEPERDPTPF